MKITARHERIDPETGVNFTTNLMSLKTRTLSGTEFLFLRLTISENEIPCAGMNLSPF
jgi:hypothetical protein